jgi:dihydrofolate synthase / folylpolyglutamate synthase
MTISDTLTYLYNLQFFGMKLGLENIRALCESLGNPQNYYPSFHVAGTNGKGTTCACLDAIFSEAGFKSGLYTSPHIRLFSERIRIQGRPVSEEDVIHYTDLMRNKIDELRATFFEATTAMAFQYFKDQTVDFAVIETGLGGRLDATNIITPEAAIITSIDLDHTEHLGTDKINIAAEKGGIIKPGIPVIIGEKDPDVMAVLKQIADDRSSEFFCMDDFAEIINPQVTVYGSSFDVEFYFRDEMRRFSNLMIPFIGEHQIRNAVMAILAVLLQNRCTVPEDAIRYGLRNAWIKGRMEWLAPNIVMDAAHNPSSLKALRILIDTVFRTHFKKIYIVIGLLADKDIPGCIENLSGAADHFFTVTPNNPRALNGKELADQFETFGQPATAYNSIEKAMNKAKHRMSEQDLLIITGSHFVLSEIS